MTSSKKKLRIGIVGCGAIGSRIARSIKIELKDLCKLTSLYDIDKRKAKEVEKRRRFIPKEEVFAREKKIIEFEKIKEEATKGTDDIFNLINKAERLAQEYEIKKKEGIK